MAELKFFKVMKKEEVKMKNKTVKGKNKRTKIFSKKSVSQELQKQLDEALDGWKRARADYDNLKKRTTFEQIETIKRANERLVLDLLPVVDNFNQAFKGLSEEDLKNGWVKGFEFIKRQLEDLLPKYNVKEIKTIGEQLDLEKHEVVLEEENKDFKKGEVIKEIRKGYLMSDRVIRVARVVVAK